MLANGPTIANVLCAGVRFGVCGAGLLIVAASVLQHFVVKVWRSQRENSVLQDAIRPKFSICIGIQPRGTSAARF